MLSIRGWAKWVVVGRWRQRVHTTHADAAACINFRDVHVCLYPLYMYAGRVYGMALSSIRKEANISLLLR